MTTYTVNAVATAVISIKIEAGSPQEAVRRVADGDGIEIYTDIAEYDVDAEWMVLDPVKTLFITPIDVIDTDDLYSTIACQED